MSILDRLNALRPPPPPKPPTAPAPTPRPRPPKIAALLAMRGGASTARSTFADLVAPPAAPKPHRERTLPEIAQEVGELADGFEEDAPVRSQVASRIGPTNSAELRRILVLPRRPADPSQAPDLTERFAKPGATWRLKPIQSWALWEMGQTRGLLGPIAAGSGKTIITLLAPHMFPDVQRAVLLVPPQLRNQLLRKDIPDLCRQFRLPLDRLRIVAYSELSSAGSANILEEYRPGLIIADECHNLAHRDSARSKRFLRYFREHPETLFVGLSGTVTRKSLRDYAHLAELALRERSPMPRGFRELADWADALDVTDEPSPPGALLALCSPEERAAAENPLRHRDPAAASSAQAAVRSGFRRRLVETPGVVATSEGAIGTSLIIRGLRPKVPPEVACALGLLRTSWEIGGEELTDPMAVGRVARQIACGFWYRWVWPNGEKDFVWLGARNAWAKECREILKRSRKGLDSPMLVARAAAAGKIATTSWAAWAEQRHKKEPPREAVWISDFLLDAAAKWASESDRHTGGIIWYTHSSWGEALAKRTGLPFFGPGQQASQELITVRPATAPTIICSLRAHGTGKNLQAYARNLFVSPMCAGLDWEQALARTHRPGQEADEVWADVFLHVAESERAFADAIISAEYLAQTQNAQKLLYATRIDCEATT